MIVAGKFKISKELSENAKSVITMFQIKSPKDRLGANGFDEIKSHPFFSQINWENLKKKEIAPPFIPTTSDRNLKHKDQFQIYQPTPEHSSEVNCITDYTYWTYEEKEAMLKFQNQQLKENIF